MWRNATERRHKPLGCNDSAGPLHRPFALPGRLVGVLGSIIQMFRLSMLDRRHGGGVCDLVTGKLVGDQHPRPAALLLQKFLEEPGRGPAISPGLDEDVEHVAVLVDSPSQVFSDSADLDEHFVKMPLVASTWLISAQRAGVFGPEPRTPSADRLVRHHDPTRGDK